MLALEGCFLTQAEEVLLSPLAWLKENEDSKESSKQQFGKKYLIFKGGEKDF